MSRVALVVLGMHRSGTSALTRTLNLLGATLPAEVLGAGTGNETGHWEPERLVAENDSLLESGESRWYDWQPFDVQSLSAPNLEHHAANIARILDEEYGDSPLIVLKDPRICRLKEMYHGILTKAGFEPRYILPLRNPLEVIASLNKRENLQAPFSSFLWLRYVLDAEFATREDRRVFTSFDALLTDWRKEVSEIAGALDLDLSEHLDEAAPALDGFLSKEQRHHSRSLAELDEADEIDQSIKDTYRALLQLKQNPHDAETMRVLDEIRDRFDRQATPAARALAEEMIFRRERDARDIEHLKRLVANASQAEEFSANDLAEQISRLEDAQHAALQSLNEALTKQIGHVVELMEKSERDRAAVEALTILQSQQSALLQSYGIEANSLETLAASLAAQEQAMASLTSEINAAMATNAALAATQNELEHRLQTAEAERNEAHHLVRSIYASRSWRLAGPLRRVTRVVRSMTQQTGNRSLVPAAAPRTYQPTRLGILRKFPGLRGLRRHAIATVRSAFDTDYYLRTYPDLAGSGIDPFRHYVDIGWREGRDPAPNFSTKFYLRSHPDIAEAGINPFAHYILHGQAEARSIRAAELVRVAQDVESCPMNEIDGLEIWSLEQIDTVRAAFDTDYYLQKNPDLAECDTDLFRHYMAFGWREGRDPSPEFSTEFYLRSHSDIASAGLNPFAHYILHGQFELRGAISFAQRLNNTAYWPKITAIVPNYNHARFLEQRVASILEQSYADIEVVILDDCSTDNSRDVIAKLAERFPTRIRTIFNTENSGNIFRQWRKGIEAADGELIWICESDDFCEPDFVERLVPYFKDRSVNLAFGRIQFSNREGAFQGGLDDYREGAEPGIWDTPLTRPASVWFRNGFGVNNVIANVGGCLMRRPELSSEVWERAQTFSVLGDWFLYLHIAGGGQISYDPKAVAYFRQHGSNTSVVAFKKPGFYTEHRQFMTELRQTWPVPASTVERFVGKVEFQYRHFNQPGDLEPFEDLIALPALLKVRRTRPHILIGILGFHAGGGELFPIHLANALSRKGHMVSIVALDMKDINTAMLDLLSPAIAVYDAAFVEDYGTRRFLEDAGVTVIHSHMVAVDVFFLHKHEIGRLVPYLVTLHGSYEAAQVGPEQLAMIGRSVAHWVYTADKNLTTLLPLRLPKSDFTKMRNAMPIDDKPFPMTREELGIAPDAVVFTLVARGILRKGWRAAISAFLRLRDAHPSVPMHLLLCGDGEQARVYSATHGEDPDITFLGFQSRIHGLYRLTDCAIVPTRFAGESYPLCIIQALQTGTPVIATRVGEIESMLTRDGTAAGLLIDNLRNTEDFIDGLYRNMEVMLDTSERRKFAEAAALLSESYDLARLADEYLSIYEGIQ